MGKIDQKLTTFIRVLKQSFALQHGIIIFMGEILGKFLVIVKRESTKIGKIPQNRDTLGKTGRESGNPAK